jgi:hypothetical protein
MLTLGGAAGCGGGAGGTPRLTSFEHGGRLALGESTRVYASSDRNTADIFVTDLPPGVWNDGVDVSAMTGTITHVRMFLASRPGRTPVEPTANSATIRVLVLAGGAMGLYGGGGFFDRSGDPGGSTFAGSVRAGTLKLIRATPGFVDRLGPCAFEGAVTAKRDPEQTARLARAFEALAREASPVAPPESAQAPSEAMSRSAAPK